MNIISSSRFALKLNRAKMNPSIDEIHSVNRTPGTAMISVLKKYFGRSPTVHAVTKLSKFSVRGIDTTPSLITSPYGRIAVNRVHSIGNSQIRDSPIRKACRRTRCQRKRL